MLKIPLRLTSSFISPPPPSSNYTSEFLAMGKKRRQSRFLLENYQHFASLWFYDLLNSLAASSHLGSHSFEPPPHLLPPFPRCLHSNLALVCPSSPAHPHSSPSTCVPSASWWQLAMGGVCASGLTEPRKRK
jgi:hypothetical protein